MTDPAGFQIGNDLFEAPIVFRNGRDLDRYDRDMAHGRFHLVQIIVRRREIEADLVETGRL